MRKLSKSLLALVFALFTSQGIMAQDVLFEEPFEWGQGAFKVEGFNSDSGNVWQWMFMYHGVVCDAKNKIIGPIETRFVSPEITLSNNNVASFSSIASNFTDVANEIAFSVREVGGEWTDLKLPVIDNAENDVMQDVTIPDNFNGKKVEVAFKYTAQSSDESGKWVIKNLVVKGGGGAEPVEKVDPGLSYNVSEITYKIGESFTAPVLSNPNNVVVKYTSSNTSVATINALGYLSVNGEGVTTIKAYSSETDKFLAGEASYVLTVTSTGGGGGATKTAIFEATFDYDMEGFVVEGNNGTENNVWQWRMGVQDLYADAYGKFDINEGALENRLVSPSIKLGKDNVVTFSSNTSWYSGDLSSNLAFSVREEGGEWVDLALKNADGMGGNLSEEFALPADFNGKTVQIGFKYRAEDLYNTAMWYIDNIVVKGVKSGDTPEKADPQISFNVGDVEAFLGHTFEAPILNNPNNVTVHYTSNKPEVAAVDPLTGFVTLLGEGYTTITATSVENEYYKSVSVNYVLTVKPASASAIIFEENFDVSMGEFVVEGYNGEGDYNIWINTSGYARADAYSKIQEETTNYLVSPQIALDAVGNEVILSYRFTNYDSDYAIDKQIGFCVREVGGEWEELVMSECKAGDVKCTIAIPSAYAGKTVQFACKYTARASITASIWDVDNILVQKAAAAKKEAELSFPFDEYEYEFGPDKFVAPVLNNPNNLEVVYSTNDINVADVDPYSGEVWVYNYGTVVVTASFEGNDEFNAGSASYTLIVTDVPTGIEGITADDVKAGKVFNLQGIRVDKLGKGVYIVNGKKVVIK